MKNRLLDAWLQSPEAQNFREHRNFQAIPVLEKILKSSRTPCMIWQNVFQKLFPEESKSLGLHYTPEPIARQMVRQALQSWSNAHDGVEALRSVKILDPACGSGIFLFLAWQELLRLRKAMEPEKAPEVLSKEILQNNLYGMDFSASAIAALEMLAFAQSGSRFPEAHLVCTNALDNPEAELLFHDVKAKFDLVLGNPPYLSFGLRGRRNLDSGEIGRLRRNFPHSAEYKLSSCVMFMELAIRSMGDGGIMNFIVPDSFLLGHYFSKIRGFLLENTHIEHIILVRKKIFRATPGYCVIIQCVKGPASADVPTRIGLVKESSTLPRYSVTIRKSEFQNNPAQRFRLFFQEKLHQKILAMERDAVCVLSDLLDIQSGLIGRYGKSSIVSQTCPDPAVWKKGIASGRAIQPDQPVCWDGSYLCCQEEKIKSGLKNIDYGKPKILFRQTGDHIVSAVDESGLFVLNNVHVGIPKGSIDLSKLCRYLNSQEVLVYYQAITLEKGRPLAQIDIDILNSIPLKERFER